MKDSGFGVEKDVSEVRLLERMSSSRLFLVRGVPIRRRKEDVGHREDKSIEVVSTRGAPIGRAPRPGGGTRP